MYNLVDLSNKHILITGASSGIGKETAILASKLGARLSLVGRKKETLENVLSQLDGNGHFVYECDITNFNELDHLVSSVVENSGLIDGFVHSAGIEMTRPLKMLKVNHYNDVFNINIISALELTRIITKNNNISKESSIIFISSIVGLLGQAGKTAYSASKGALLAASRCLSLELASKGIRVNTILPALVETEMSLKILESISEESKDNILKMHPLGFGKAIDIANSAAFLLSPASKWITGAEFIIDGGYSAS